MGGDAVAARRCVFALPDDEGDDEADRASDPGVSPGRAG